MLDIFYEIVSFICRMSDIHKGDNYISTFCRTWPAISNIFFVLLYLSPGVQMCLILQLTKRGTNLHLWKVRVNPRTVYCYAGFILLTRAEYLPLVTIFYVICLHCLLVISFAILSLFYINLFLNFLCSNH